MSELGIEGTPASTASQAGWRASRYNIAARIPNDPQGRFAVSNLCRGNCGACPPLELAALAMLDELPPNHPAVERLARRGLVVKYDELAALEARARMACAHPGAVNLTICPTMGCNFDCPYCFEAHGGRPMSPEVQDDVVALAERMMDVASAKVLRIVWFGGEPLLALDVIEALSKRLIAVAENRGATYEAQAVTNGYLLSEQAAKLLGEARVNEIQVTLDGIGAAHDATRHLASGGATFDRIVENLARPGLPFCVSVRYNVHEENLSEADDVRAFVEKLAASSGNTIVCYPALVLENEAADQRGRQVGIVDDSLGAHVLLSSTLHNINPHPIHCGAGNIFDVGIDAEGRLQKCWEAVDKPELSFGNAHDWDPADPLMTASDLDKLTCFLNQALPLDDDECAACLWLPVCAGGCPYKRLVQGKRKCLPYKNEPEEYVLALWRDTLAGKSCEEQAKEASGLS